LKWIVWLSVVFLLSACVGGGGNSNSSDTEDNSDDTTQETDISLEPHYQKQWHLVKNNTVYLQNSIDDNAHIHAGNLLKTYSGKNIKIAIIDDGLDTNHEDLENAIVSTYDIVSKSSNVEHLNQNDQHGTAVTGIIGARANEKGILGIAYNSGIIFLKHKENMSDSETIELFNKAEEFGADIISNSWGTYNVSPAVKDKIQDLAINGRNGKGMLIIFAVGNDNQDMGNDESAIPEVIAVGSMDTDNTRAWYSNYGENLDILAPGGNGIGITTLDPTGIKGLSILDEDYLLHDDPNSFVATSASAPIISGIIALMLEKNPNLTRIQIEDILKNSSDKIGSFNYENGRNNYYGYGKVNLTNLFQLIPSTQ